LLAVAGALLRCPPLAVLALRRVVQRSIASRDDRQNAQLIPARALKACTGLRMFVEGNAKGRGGLLIDLDPAGEDRFAMHLQGRTCSVRMYAHPVQQTFDAQR
jgi:hypothetical protein